MRHLILVLIALTVVTMDWTTGNKTLPDQCKWDCAYNGHKMSSDGKWKTCSECGYTTKA